MKIVLLVCLASFGVAVVGAMVPDREERAPLVSRAIVADVPDAGRVPEGSEDVISLRSELAETDTREGSARPALEARPAVRSRGPVGENGDAVRGWFLFQRFLDQQAIDASSLDEERFASLFQRFLLLDTERNAELGSVVSAPVRLDPESAGSEVAVEIALVESIEARYATRETELARELGFGR